MISIVPSIFVSSASSKPGKIMLIRPLKFREAVRLRCLNANCAYRWASRLIRSSGQNPQLSFVFTAIDDNK
jgi:hypothetical protein